MTALGESMEPELRVFKGDLMEMHQKIYKYEEKDQNQWV